MGRNFRGMHPIQRVEPTKIHQVAQSTFESDLNPVSHDHILAGAGANPQSLLAASATLPTSARATVIGQLQRQVGNAQVQRMISQGRAPVADGGAAPGVAQNTIKIQREGVGDEEQGGPWGAAVPFAAKGAELGLEHAAEGAGSAFLEAGIPELAGASAPWLGLAAGAVPMVGGAIEMSQALNEKPSTLSGLKAGAGAGEIFSGGAATTASILEGGGMAGATSEALGAVATGASWVAAPVAAGVAGYEAGTWLNNNTVTGDATQLAMDGIDSALGWAGKGLGLKDEGDNSSVLGNHPIAAGLASIPSAAFGALAGVGQLKAEADQAVGSGISSAAGWLGDKAINAAGEGINTAGHVADEVDAGVSAASNWVGGEVDAASDFVGSEVDAAEGKVNEAADWAGGKVDAASSWVGGMFDSASSWVGDKVDAAGAGLNSAADWGKDKVANVNDRILDAATNARERDDAAAAGAN